MAVTLSPTTLPAGTVNAPYSQQLSAAGGVSPYTFAVTVGSLPAGLTLTSGGLLSGTVTSVSTTTFTVTATDSTATTHLTGSQGYTLTFAVTAVLTLPCPSYMCQKAAPVNFIELGGNRILCPRCEQVSTVSGGVATHASGYHA